MMLIKCPKCGSKFELDQAVEGTQQAQIHDLAAKLGPHWQLVYEYTDCFRQSEFGSISLARRLRLLKQISDLFEPLTFTFRKCRYRTTQHDLIKAMTEPCNRNKWGFQNHHYLLTILVKTAERLSAEGLSAQEEQAREDHRAHGQFRQGEPGQLDFRVLIGEEEK